MAETELLEHPKPSGDGGHGHGGGGSHGKKHGGGHGGGHEEAHEGAPEWLISFADNVMLQMGFFVILLAMAMRTAGGAGAGAGEAKEQQEPGQPSAEALDFAIAVREAFNNPVSISSTDPNDRWLVYRLRSRTQGLSDAKGRGLAGADHDVQSIRKSGMYGSGGLILFETDSTAFDDSAKAAITELAQHFRGWKCTLDIRGHTSAQEAFNQDDRGMHLAYERAFAVGAALVAEGVTWEQLRVTACADAERQTPTAYDDAGQRSNQRVEVVEVNTNTPPPR